MINAKALVCGENQKITLTDVNLPDPNDDQVLIKTSYSGVSIGTEFALIRNKISWGPYPLCTGYMGSGVIESVGANIEKFTPGDKVYYRANDAMSLPDGTPISSVTGAHCSHIVTNPGGDHGVDHLIEGADMEDAAMFVMPAVGLFGVDMAQPKLGETVVVHGAGLIGLGVIAALAHRGCVVVAVDINSLQLNLAKQMGADYAIDGSNGDALQKLLKIAPDGADAVFECTGLPQCIGPAIEMCKTEGSFIWQGNYGAQPFPFEFLPAHGRKLKMFFPCDDGLQPCRRAVVKNMASDALKWNQVITHRVKYTEAADLFARINQGEKDIVGAVIHWAD